MAKSKAKKMRDKMTREGKRNPDLSISKQNIKSDYQTERTVPEMIVFLLRFIHLQNEKRAF
jgi:hypothetical protein